MRRPSQHLTLLTTIKDHLARRTGAVLAVSHLDLAAVPVGADLSQIGLIADQEHRLLDLGLELRGDSDSPADDGPGRMQHLDDLVMAVVVCDVDGGVSVYRQFVDESPTRQEVRHNRLVVLLTGNVQRTCAAFDHNVHIRPVLDKVPHHLFVT